MGPTDVFQYIHATYMDQVQPPSTILLHQGSFCNHNFMFKSPVFVTSADEREHSVLVVLCLDYST